MSSTVAVVGAAGGCGTTSIALHLAAIAARTRRVCLVEAGPGAGSAERLGLERAALAARAGGEDVALRALPMAAGFRALFARLDASDVVLGEVEAFFEAVVVDVPAGTPPPDGCRALIVVPHSAPGARRARALLVALPGPAVVVTNRAGPGSQLTGRRVEQLLGTHVTLALPACPSLRAAEDDGRLVPGWSPWRRRVERLAAALLHPAPPREAP